jgi:hypothetical protein
LGDGGCAKLLVKNHGERDWIARSLLNLKALMGLVMICYQNVEWLINHRMWRSADPGHIGRVRGFFWLLHVGAGVAADLFSIRAHRRTSRGLLAELESMNPSLPSTPPPPTPRSSEGSVEAQSRDQDRHPHGCRRPNPADPDASSGGVAPFRCAAPRHHSSFIGSPCLGIRTHSES